MFRALYDKYKWCWHNWADWEFCPKAHPRKVVSIDQFGRLNTVSEKRVITRTCMKCHKTEARWSQLF